MVPSVAPTAAFWPSAATPSALVAPHGSCPDIYAGVTPARAEAPPETAWRKVSGDALAKRRVAATYGYAATGLGITAGSAALACARGAAWALTTGLTPWLIAATGFGSLFAATLTPTHAPVAKHTAWALFHACTGLLLTPLAAAGAPVLVPAALITLALTGSLALVASLAPAGTFDRLEGPLTAALLAVVVVGAGQVFLPAAWGLFAMAHGLVIYGGLAIFAGLTLLDTQQLHREARRPGSGFDPIDHSLGLSLNAINVFVRLVELVARYEGE